MRDTRFSAFEVRMLLAVRGHVPVHIAAGLALKVKEANPEDGGEAFPPAFMSGKVGVTPVATHPEAFSKTHKGNRCLACGPSHRPSAEGHPLGRGAWGARV